MSARNDITGDFIKSRSNNAKFSDNWDRIFKRNADTSPDPELEQPEQKPEFSSDMYDTIRKEQARKFGYALPDEEIRLVIDAYTDWCIDMYQKPL